MIIFFSSKIFPDFFPIFFSRSNFFFEVEKKLGYSFDAENWELSIAGVFSVIWALWSALEQKDLFSLIWNDTLIKE